MEAWDHIPVTISDDSITQPIIQTSGNSTLRSSEDESERQIVCIYYYEHNFDFKDP